MRLHHHWHSIYTKKTEGKPHITIELICCLIIMKYLLHVQQWSIIFIVFIYNNKKTRPYNLSSWYVDADIGFASMTTRHLKIWQQILLWKIHCVNKKLGTSIFNHLCCGQTKGMKWCKFFFFMLFYSLQKILNDLCLKFVFANIYFFKFHWIK